MTKDPMAALRSLVVDDIGVIALLDESTSEIASEARIYVNRIPEADIEAADTFHPPKMVVLRQSGGSSKIDTLPIEDLRINVLCYGESDFEADRVRRGVFKLFTHADRQRFGSVLIHHINAAGGPIPLVDPDIVWPAMSQAYTLQADTEDAA